MKETATPRRFPIQITLMIAILVAVMTAGYLMMPRTEEQRLAFVERMGTTNHGTLLYPEVDLSQADWRDEAGQPWALDASEARWRMVLPVAEPCDENCRQLLYVTRQIHVRLGKQADRLERIYVNVGDPLSAEQQEFLDSEHPGIRIVHYPADDFAAHFSKTNGRWAGETRSYLVDPQGVAMMYHDASLAGSDILEDLNHLLKLSAH